MICHSTITHSFTLTVQSQWDPINNESFQFKLLNRCSPRFFNISSGELSAAIRIFILFLSTLQNLIRIFLIYSCNDLLLNFINANKDHAGFTLYSSHVCKSHPWFHETIIVIYKLQCICKYSTLLPLSSCFNFVIQPVLV